MKQINVLNVELGQYELKGLTLFPLFLQIKYLKCSL